MLRNLWTAAGPASILQTGMAGGVCSTFFMSDITLFKSVTVDCSQCLTWLLSAWIQARVRDIMHSNVGSWRNSARFIEAGVSLLSGSATADTRQWLQL